MKHVQLMGKVPPLQKADIGKGLVGTGKKFPTNATKTI